MAIESFDLTDMPALMPHELFANAATQRQLGYLAAIHRVLDGIGEKEVLEGGWGVSFRQFRKVYGYSYEPVEHRYTLQTLTPRGEEGLVIEPLIFEDVDGPAPGEAPMLITWEGDHDAIFTKLGFDALKFAAEDMKYGVAYNDLLVDKTAKTVDKRVTKFLKGFRTAARYKAFNANGDRPRFMGLAG